jgi:hypothetical protein
VLHSAFHSSFRPFTQIPVLSKRLADESSPSLVNALFLGPGRRNIVVYPRMFSSSVSTVFSRLFPDFRIIMSVMVATNAESSIALQVKEISG